LTFLLRFPHCAVALSLVEPRCSSYSLSLSTDQFRFPEGVSFVITVIVEGAFVEPPSCSSVFPLLFLTSEAAPRLLASGLVLPPLTAPVISLVP